MDNEEDSLALADNAREKEHLRRVEAALFISGRYLSMKELVSLTDLNPILIRKVLADLTERYQDSAIEVVQKDDMWKMDIANEYSSMVNKLATGSSEFTKAEQETLAIIAYKQPIKQSVLIKIRGNKGYDHISHFASLGLVTKKRSGHTWDLSLSDSFYDYFHLSRDQPLSEKS